MAPDANSIMYTLITGLQPLVYVSLVMTGLLVSLARWTIAPVVSGLAIAFSMHLFVNMTIDEFKPETNSNTLVPTITASATPATSSSVTPPTPAGVYTSSTGPAVAAAHEELAKAPEKVLATAPVKGFAEGIATASAAPNVTPPALEHTSTVPAIPTKPVKVEVYVPNTEAPRKSVNLYKEISGN